MFFDDIDFLVTGKLPNNDNINSSKLVDCKIGYARGNMFKDEYSVSGGASGAIFGVVGALLVIVIKNRGQLEDLSSRQLMFFAGFSIYHGVTSAGIDNMAHISGFLIGALLGGLLYRRKRYWKQNSKGTAATW